MCIVDLLRWHPAYQFSLLPLAACALLLRREWTSISHLSLHSPWVKALYALHLLLAAAAFALPSPALAGIALFIAAAALAVAMARLPGMGTAPWIFPAMMLFLIPPPLHLDSTLHQKMSGLASHLSEDWLDLMKIDHLVEGAVVVTGDKSFFVDDACSGTNSLLITVCMALIVCGFYRRSLLHTLAVFTSAGLIAVAANVLRICVVIGGSVKLGLELEKGWPHEALGIASFLLDLLLVWSADRGWQFILNFAERAENPGDLNPTTAGMQRPVWLARTSTLVAFVGLLLWAGPEVLAATRAARSSASGLSVLDAFEFPKQLAGWERVGDGAQEDSLVGKLGVRNQVWLYSKGTVQVHLAVNFPFLGFHDTRICYQGRGWRLDSQEDTPIAGGTDKSVRHLSMTQLAELSHGDVWLSVMQQDGTPRKYEEEKQLNGFFERAASRWTGGEDDTKSTCVLQVMAVEQTLGEAEKKAVDELIAAGLQEVKAKLANTSNPAPKGAAQ